jgi:hypothetical protein
MRKNPYKGSINIRSHHRNSSSKQTDLESLRNDRSYKKMDDRGNFRRANRKQRDQDLTQRRVWLGLVVLVIGFFLSMLIFKRQHVGENISQTPSSQYLAISSMNSKPIIWDGPQPHEVADLFLRASTHEERLRLIRNPEQAGPIMDKFFTEGAGKYEKVINQMIVDSVDDGNFIMDRMELTMNDGKPRMLCIVHCNGRALVDFESYARCGSTTWDEILSGKVNKAERMRVIIENNNYYNYSFNDETKWISFVANTPELPNSIYLYGSSDNQAFLDLKKSIGTGTMTCTISIEATNEGAPCRQFILSKLIAKDWVTP